MKKGERRSEHERSLEDVAAELGLTKNRISQIEHAALDKIRAGLNMLDPELKLPYSATYECNRVASSKRRARPKS